MKKNGCSLVRRFCHVTCITLILAFAGRFSRAEDYVGATKLLQEVKERNARPGEKPKPDEQSRLREDLKTFVQTSTNLAPAEWVRQWLALADRAIKAQKHTGGNFNRSPMSMNGSDLLGALPPPVAWPEFARAVAARPKPGADDELSETGLKILAATLTTNVDWRNRELTNLQAKAQSADTEQAFFFRTLLQQISRILIEMSDDPELILRSFERQVALAGGQNPQMLDLPNLVSIVGPEKTEAFLRKALVTPNVTLQFNLPNKTSRLAQKVCLELMSQLKTPQWSLVNSLDSLELYEAMDRQFPTPTNVPPAAAGLPAGLDIPDAAGGADYPKTLAKAYYMLGLVSHDRPKDAVVVAKTFGGAASYYFQAAFNSMEKAGYTTALDNFLYELLSQNPMLPFWDEYVGIAAHAGTTDRMLALVRSAVAGGTLGEKKKNSLHQILFRALLASDQVDEAVSEIKKLMAADPVADDQQEDFSSGRLAVLLARLGFLLKNPELTAEGIEAAKKWLASPDARRPAYEFQGSVSGELAGILFDLGRGPEAEAVLMDALADATRPQEPNPQTYVAMATGKAPAVLKSLLLLYHNAGRFDDVLKLLQESPDWEAKDLADLPDGMFGNASSIMFLHTGAASMPVRYLVANALLAKGEKDSAARITDSLLNDEPGSDRGYELLLAIQGTNAIPKLDELFSRDQFEERPLIWKAHLLRQMNQLDAAEKIIRQAITIDPSDGEEGRGDRMRAYSELADILQAKGDTNSANSQRKIVKAIRLSETADQFYAVGLLKRAIPMYEEGLGHFADAYCIQSRLAIQLSELGQNEAAEAHYRRAYELMPESFGRVESHCFGCERAFDGERAQGIAEKVFSKLAIEEPNKPQVHYLLGYLREAQESFNEAQSNYLDAVRLDPDYLNAWVKLQEVSQQTLMSSKMRDAVAFNILRLDPLQRHSRPNFSRVSDLPGLWNQVAAAVSKEPVPVTNLMVLTASKAALASKAEHETTNPMYNGMQFGVQSWMDRSGDNLSPARAIATTPYVRLASLLILGQQNAYLNDE